ncbi:MAG: cobalt-precorrin-6A reductase [Alphaproteobacteria bacterium]
MDERRTVLILGGTGEALALARRLAAVPEIRAVSSLAGRTRSPVKPEGELRIGGFGGVDGLVRYIRDEKVDVVVDATHPFAAQMSANAAAACDVAHVARLLLLRAEWPRLEGDDWHVVSSIEAAVAALPLLGRRVFLTTGGTEIRPFGRLAEHWFLIRVVDTPRLRLPLPNYEVVVGRGPFAEADDAALMQRHGIEVLVSKNSGGPATYGKIAAARRLGVPVVMVARPVPPLSFTVETAEAAARWVVSRLGLPPERVAV